ncbi:hypothetical protein SAMN05661080_03124 [Modestobacter sp. DSM 44400]|uniref:hypothetical protein n=1 Tax=Modestobacter sp. DSM 44400 TaxID=1550230 RepID=UPI000895BAF9|nr:hypothetical protein [Modestobacter sp. DSM 44400]SDY33364.1 hypothetical protein SAMN05661080_03124 [Modestobacter sp. DSM 44400]
MRATDQGRRLPSSLVDSRRQGQRWVVAAAALVAGTAHLPVIAPHLAEAPYMGVLFVVLSAGCLAIAATIWFRDPAVLYVLAVGTCGLAVLGYAATRLVAFPLLGDDLGNWWEPLGVLSVGSETVAVAAAVSALLGRPRTATDRHRPAPVRLAGLR